MKDRKGFTLVELIIVIVIVGILSIVAVPVYKGYTKKAMATEGKSLISSVVTAEKTYFVEYNHYKFVADTNYDKDLGIDSRSNKYFTLFAVDLLEPKEKFEGGFVVGIAGNQGSGADYISMGMVVHSTSTPTLHEYYEPGGFEKLGLELGVPEEFL